MRPKKDVNISKCYTIRGTPQFFDKQDEEFKRLQAEAKGGSGHSLRD